MQHAKALLTTPSVKLKATHTSVKSNTHKCYKQHVQVLPAVVPTVLPAVATVLSVVPSVLPAPNLLQRWQHGNDFLANIGEFFFAEV